MKQWVVTILLALATVCVGSTALAGDVVDTADEVEDLVNDFNGSDCGKAIKGCWKDVKSAINDTNKACKAFNKCKKKCRVSKRSDKKACFAKRCTGLRGKAQRDCKKGCRQGARLVKRSCIGSCGKRPAGCRTAWGGVFRGIAKCVKSIKDADCKAWANKIGQLAKSVK